MIDIIRVLYLISAFLCVILITNWGIKRDEKSFQAFVVAALSSIHLQLLQVMEYLQ